MNQSVEKRAVTTARWAARTLSVLLLWLFVTMAIGEATPEHLREMALGNALFTMLVGLIVAWKREGLGSLLILGGFAAFALVNARLNILVPWPLHNPFFTFLIVGMLFLFCWWRTRRIARG